MNQNDVQLRTKFVKLFLTFIFSHKPLAFAKFSSDKKLMNSKHYLILCLTLSMGFLGCQKDVETVEENSEITLSHDQAEKPIEHLKLEDIASESNAVEVMQSTTEQLRAKTKLDALELHEIHMITYSLEKAVAFFAENLSGARQVIAQEMAVVVEEIHLSSENNRMDATKEALDQYFALIESFTKGS
jgi:hypothetical protein